VHGADPVGPGAAHVGLQIVAHVENLVRRHGHGIEDHAEQVGALACPVLAGREDAVELQVVERVALDDPAELGAVEVRVGHQDHPGSEGVLGRLGQMEDVQVGEGDRPLELHLQLGQRCRRHAAEEVARQLGVDRFEGDLRQSPGGLDTAPGLALRPFPQPGEQLGRHLVAQVAASAQAVPEEHEGVHRLGHGTPQQGVENVERQYPEGPPLQQVEGLH